MTENEIIRKLDGWLDVLNDCGEAVEILAEQYPDDWEFRRVKYDKVIASMYNLYKDLCNKEQD